MPARHGLGATSQKRRGRRVPWVGPCDTRPQVVPRAPNRAPGHTAMTRVRARQLPEELDELVVAELVPLDDEDVV